VQRILIIGSGGAGKSTFSTKLGVCLDLPVIHLDTLYWRPGWVDTPPEEWAKVVAAEIARPRWIMDGNYGGTMEMRLAACDTVIFLHLSPWICLRRALYRRWKYRRVSRPDMNPGCPEQIDLEFLKWIWNYPATKAPKILEMLERLKPTKTVVVLRSPREIDDFLVRLSPATSASAT